MGVFFFSLITVEVCRFLLLNETFFFLIGTGFASRLKFSRLPAAFLVQLPLLFARHVSFWLPYDSDNITFSSDD